MDCTRLNCTTCFIHSFSCLPCSHTLATLCWNFTVTKVILHAMLLRSSIPCKPRMNAKSTDHAFAPLCLCHLFHVQMQDPGLVGLYTGRASGAMTLTTLTTSRSIHLQSTPLTWYNGVKHVLAGVCWHGHQCHEHVCRHLLQVRFPMEMQVYHCNGECDAKSEYVVCL